MAIPNWVRFTLFEDQLAGLVTSRLAPLMQRYECRLFKVSRLGFDPYEERFGFAGDVHPGNTLKLSSEQQALDATRDWDGMCLAYKAVPVTSYLYVYLWHLQGGTAAAVEVDSSILFHRSDDDEPGEWLQRFLVDVTTALNADASAYGNGYEVEYLPLLLEAVVERIASTAVMTTAAPTFHAVARRAVDAALVRRAVESGTNARVRYFATTGGYHVFANLR